MGCLRLINTENFEPVLRVEHSKNRGTESPQLDARLGRWMSPDPVFRPHVSPYNSMDGNPINMNDPLGLTPGGGNFDPKGNNTVPSSATNIKKHKPSGELNDEGKSEEPIQDSDKKAIVEPGFVKSFQIGGETFTAKFGSKSGKFKGYKNSDGETVEEFEERQAMYEEWDALDAMEAEEEALDEELAKYNWIDYGDSPPHHSETANFWRGAAAYGIGGAIAVGYVLPAVIEASPMLVSKGSATTVATKMAVSATTQAVVNGGDVNVVGVVADGFLVPGASDAVGASTELNFNVVTWESSYSSIFSTTNHKSLEEATYQFAIGTIMGTTMGASRVPLKNSGMTEGMQNATSIMLNFPIGFSSQGLQKIVSDKLDNNE